MPLIYPRRGLIRPRGFIKPSGNLAVDPRHHLSRGLVAYWPLGEQSNGIARDLVGGFDATLQAGPSVLNPSHHGGQALLFAAASSQYATITRPIIFPVPIRFAISVWVNKKTAGTQDVVAASNVAVTNAPFFLRVGATSSGFTAGGGNFQTVTVTDLTLGVWHHLVLTHDGPTLRYYVDGLLSATAGVSGVPDTMSASDFAIGKLGAFVGSQYWDGNIADLRIYSRNLSATDASILFSEPFAGVYPVTNQFIIGGLDAGGGGGGPTPGASVNRNFPVLSSRVFPIQVGRNLPLA
jgi:hypothetical protein